MYYMIRRCAVAIAVIAAAIFFARPQYPFSPPYSTVITDSTGAILGAHIADDGQWRFPQADSVPYKFRQCITAYEDKRFYRHHGIDIMALARAIYLNTKSMGIRSGGSTITMQTIRLAHPQSRTISAKISEMWQALRLECRYSKDEIMLMYASHAPFGGNTVGLETASQRYFGRPAHTLSWAESATLAVLPNNPALIHLSRNRHALMQKRNSLLQRLCDNGVISAETCQLSQAEPLPGAPRPYPQTAPHLLARAARESAGHCIKTTLDISTQLKAQNILAHHTADLRANGIENAAILIMEVRSGHVVAYIGNTPPDPRKTTRDANDVDIITAPRSTGSILKPFLYCAMLSGGQLLPNTLIPDIPTQISGYMPQNYRLTYDGAVPASKALARSLNVPAVKMLQQYSGQKFINILHKLGITTVNKPADYYGLSLILGGCEASLWQLCGAYASMARSLYGYTSGTGKYSPGDYRPPQYTARPDECQPAERQNGHSFLSAAAIYHTLNALTKVERPENEISGTAGYANVAWKTGTSFGFRDAWAIGISGNYVIGVWTGNADGEGRPNLIGIKTSAPIMFDLVKILPHSANPFPVPYNELTRARICLSSGHLATDRCANTAEQLIPASGINTSPCPYCRLIHLDAGGQYRVTADCENPANMIHRQWFVLPPAMEYYYKLQNPDYKPLPPLRSDCAAASPDSDTPIQIIYPENGARIFLPKGFDGKKQSMVIEASSRQPGDRLFWHLDSDFIAETADIHRTAISPGEGYHTVTITNTNGQTASVRFEIR